MFLREVQVPNLQYLHSRAQIEYLCLRLSSTSPIQRQTVNQIFSHLKANVDVLFSNTAHLPTGSVVYIKSTQENLIQIFYATFQYQKL